MTQVVSSLLTSEEMVAVLQNLSPDLRQQVFDFAQFLVQHHSKAEAKPNRIPGLDRGALVTSIPPRIFGLHAGQAIMTDDFDDPMPDEFWFGDNDPLVTMDEPVAEFHRRSVTE